MNKCKICNKEYIKVGLHVIQTHKLPSEEYYRKYIMVADEDKCRECTNNTKFQGITYGYLKYCSIKCSANSNETREKRKQTCLKKHGVEYPLQSTIIKEKRKQTRLERYGDENYNNREQYKQTMLKNHGVEYPLQSTIIKEKTKQTCLKKYGAGNPFQAEEVKEKIKQTMLVRYGVENLSQHPEIARKHRLRAIKRIEQSISAGGQITPFYNSEACRIIDEYGRQNGYSFQHALNGGEYHIRELGYFVDGYDEKKNTVIEYDEPHHFRNGMLNEKDIQRQREIQELLQCEFIRISQGEANNRRISLK